MKAKVSVMSRAKLARSVNWRSLLWLGLILIVGAVAVRWTVVRNSLLLRATRISSSDLRVDESYQWLDANTLLSFGIAERFRTGQATPVRIDVHTGATTRIETLNARLSDRRLRQARNGRLAPNGRQLLFLWSQGARLYASVTALDGSTVTDYPLGATADEKPMVWLPDGRRWCYPLKEDTPGTTSLAICSVDTPQGVAVVRAILPPNLSTHGLLGFDTAGRAILVGNALPQWTRVVTEAPNAVFGSEKTLSTTTGYGVPQLIATDLPKVRAGVAESLGSSMIQRGGSMIQTAKMKITRGNAVSVLTETTTSVFDPAQRNLHLLIFAPEPNGVAQHYEAKLPAGANISSLALSPRGDRIAVLLFFSRPPATYPWSRWLGQQPARREACALWTCRTDGTDFHEIGPEMSYQAGKQSGLTGLRWLPDGKKLSFIYDDALYTLPAE